MRDEKRFTSYACVTTVSNSTNTTFVCHEKPSFFSCYSCLLVLRAATKEVLTYYTNSANCRTLLDNYSHQRLTILAYV